MGKRISCWLIVAIVAAGLGACEGVAPLTADTKTPPTIATISPIKIPDWVGTVPTPYDGLYEGYLINESFYFFCPTSDVYLRLAFDVSNGLLRRVSYAAQRVPVDGYINPHGVFVANTSGKFALGELFVGSIVDDRMFGQWRSGGRLCHGRIELVRVVGNQRYCEDRLSGRPYATDGECHGIDRFLTKGEFEAMLKADRKG